MDKCQETLYWLDANQTAEKEEFEHQQKELEAICNPIISRPCALTLSKQWMIRFDFEGIKAGVGCLGVALFGRAWVVFFSDELRAGTGYAVRL